MKTKLSLSFAVAAVAAIVLAGCSSADPGVSPSPSGSADTVAQQAAADALLAKVQWKEDDDGVPTLTFDQPFDVAVTAARLVSDGDGEELKAGQAITLDYVVASGKDGSVVQSTYDNGAPEAITLTEGAIDPLLTDMLIGAHVGADFLYAVPGSSDGSVVMAVTVADQFSARAQGTPVTPTATLPAVTLDGSGAPSIATPTGTAPSDLVVQPLIKGAGESVADGDVITVQYAGWLWDGTKFDSSWDRGAPATFQLDADSLIKGWVQGIAGQTVGSQLLLVVPPSLGYGDTASSDGSIPANSTLVFVVDILAKNS